MNTLGKIAAALGTGIFAAIGAILVLALIGSAIETVGQYQDERRMCLRGATNGLDIERCK